jgi:hypothetical protein
MSAGILLASAEIPIATNSAVIANLRWSIETPSSTSVIASWIARKRNGSAGTSASAKGSGARPLKTT